MVNYYFVEGKDRHGATTYFTFPNGLDRAKAKAIELGAPCVKKFMTERKEARYATIVWRNK